MNSDVTVESIDISSAALDDITLETIGSTDSTTYTINGGYSLPTSSFYTYNTSSPSFGNVALNSNMGASGSILTSNGANGTSWGNVTTNSGLYVSSDASFDGDIKWKGRSLGDLLNKIESRLAILSPDSKKLEHFAALKKAYDNYKALEALCELPEEENESS
jgi:hypothetical protein